jgi:hypothetical protein
LRHSLFSPAILSSFSQPLEGQAESGQVLAKPVGVVDVLLLSPRDREERAARVRQRAGGGADRKDVPQLDRVERIEPARPSGKNALEKIVPIPDRRKTAASSPSRRKRDAMGSQRERSRSMTMFVASQ